jgi:gliding motility-associated-like protein
MLPKLLFRFFLSLLVSFGMIQTKAQAPCLLPSAVFNADTLLVCKDTLLDLNAGQYPGASYLWSGGGTDSIQRFTQSGRYWVEITTPSCTIQDSITLIFNSLVLSPETDTLVLCLNQPGRALQARGTNLLWYDTLAIGGTGSSSPPIATTSRLGEKTYFVSQTLYGCESPRAVALVEVVQAPQFSLGEHILIPCDAPGISLQVVEEKYTTYRWGNGQEGPVYDATRPGSYILRGENLCGTRTDTVMAVACDTRCVQFPNVFTPNGDGRNDRFTGVALCPVQKFQMTIFNRFGQQVFSSRDPNISWDGSFQGKAQPDGTYVFFCQYDDFVLKTNIAYKGTIQLLR